MGLIMSSIETQAAAETGVLNKRYPVAVDTSIRSVGNADVDLHLTGLSMTGFSGSTPSAFHVEDQVIVHIPIAGDMAARLVAVAPGEIGGEFVRPIDAAGIVADLSAI
jgi:hypothetical protein